MWTAATLGRGRSTIPTTAPEPKLWVVALGLSLTACPGLLGTPLSRYCSCIASRPNAPANISSCACRSRSSRARATALPRILKQLRLHVSTSRRRQLTTSFRLGHFTSQPAAPWPVASSAPGLSKSALFSGRPPIVQTCAPCRSSDLSSVSLFEKQQNSTACCANNARPPNVCRLSSNPRLPPAETAKEFDIYARFCCCFLASSVSRHSLASLPSPATMGRASKFAFPLRRSHADRDAHQDRRPSQPEYDYDGPQPSKAERLLGTGLPGRRTASAASGHSFPRNNSATPSLEAKKSYVSLSRSEASQESDRARKGSHVTNESLLVPPLPRFHQDQSSSRSNSQDRSGSVSSSMYSRQLNSQTSSSTLRSHYDPQRQPPHVSQQTSMSASRDGALHKGHPSLFSASSWSVDQVSQHSSGHGGDYESISGSSKDAGRKKKVPARLDLSKLFPKTPKSKDNDQHLLSPTKFVSSPVLMSSTSTHFSRPLTSPSTMNSNRTRATSVTSTKTSDTLREGRAQAAKDRAQKAPYDNAKITRRRPPPGIQHWFDGLSDDEEEEDEEEEEEREMPVERVDMRVQEPRRQPSPHDYRRQPSPPRHGRKTSHPKATLAERAYPPLERLYPKEHTYTPDHAHRQDARAVPQAHSYRADHAQTGPDTRSFEKAHLRGQPSQTSFASHDTRASTWTKGSRISDRDLKGDSVLSLSSSEDESDPRSSGTDLAPIRDSLATSTDTEGEILIGRAQAFDIRPRQNWPSRRMTAGSTSTNATIDVMLSPTTAASSQTNLVLPRHSNSRSSRRRSGHFRQVSAIPEDGYQESKHYPESISTVSCDDRDTSSIRSGRTSKSEPRSNLGHKLMAVTEEEEVLLELMRRKRAAMAKQSYTDGYRSAMKVEHARGETPTMSSEDQRRLSGFVSIASQGSDYSEPQAHTASDRRHSKKSILSQSTAAGTEASTSTLQTLANATYVPPPSRSEKKNRVPPTANEALLRSPGSSSMASSTSVSPSPRSRMVQRIVSQPPQLSPAIFSPLEVFSSPPDSPTYPATASHTGTIPSPVTPGPGFDGELRIKVAGSSIGGSEASFGTDYDSIHHSQQRSHHSHHPSDLSMSHMSKERSRKVEKPVSMGRERLGESPGAKGVDRARSHSRRRTASSGANIDMCSEKPSQLVTPEVVHPTRTSSLLDFPMPAGMVRQDAPASKSHVLPGPTDWDWDNDVDVSAVINHVRKSRSSHVLGSARTSIASSAPSLPPPNIPLPEVPQTQPSRQNSVTSHISSRSGVRGEAGDRLTVASIPSAAIAARSSVSDDVLAAWSSLGGSRGEFYG